jgi:hypothetical protein
MVNDLNLYRFTLEIYEDTEPRRGVANSPYTLAAGEGM